MQILESATYLNYISVPAIVYDRSSMDAGTTITAFFNTSDTTDLHFTSVDISDDAHGVFERAVFRQKQLLMHYAELKRMLFESFNRPKVISKDHVKKRYYSKILRCNRRGLGLRIKCK